MLKSELRKIYLARQKSLSSAERAEKSRQIVDNFFGAFDLSKVSCLHCFLPIERTGEIETKQIFERIWKEFPQVKTVVPRVDFQTNEIENLEFAANTNLVQNVWEIHEPAHDEIVDTRKIDLALIPLLCFDKKGNRVGYGKGFYDRFLKSCRPDCRKIGLAYFAPVVEISDVWEMDQKINFCVTPETVFECN